MTALRSKYRVIKRFRIYTHRVTLDTAPAHEHFVEGEIVHLEWSTETLTICKEGSDQLHTLKRSEVSVLFQDFDGTGALKYISGTKFIPMGSHASAL